jgi:hypothetical protein
MPIMSIGNESKLSLDYGPKLLMKLNLVLSHNPA